MTRYIVIGAGAVGGTIAGRLAHGGHDVVVSARGDHLRALQEDGLVLRTPEFTATVPVTAVGGPDEMTLRADDVLILATKTHQAPAALLEWADAEVFDGDQLLGSAGERLPILTALNGVASEELALRYFRRVFGVAVWLPALHLQPGEVIARGTPDSGMLHVSRVPAGEADDDDRRLLERLAEDGRTCGLRIERPANVMPWKHRKLISNIGNAFQALLGSASGDLGSQLADAARTEAREVLQGAGIEVTSDAEEASKRQDSIRVADVPGQPEQMGGSSWQSLARGTGSIETDYLNGEIALIAHRHGLHAPINATVARLARQAARAGTRPGQITPEDLATALGVR